MHRKSLHFRHPLRARVFERWACLLAGACFWLTSLPRLRAIGEEPLPSVAEMAESRGDVWGEAAIKQPTGPSYEFFRDLLPPLRYANTQFAHYPIVLCAPRSGAKARWISNGSAVNARANKPPMWRDVGTPVHFFVGDSQEAFGSNLERLDGPRYAQGYLPIVECSYRQGNVHYEQQVFAPVEPELAEQGVVLLRFKARGGSGKITARIAHDGKLQASNATVGDDRGRAILAVGHGWRYDAVKKQFTSELAEGAAAYLAVFTIPGMGNLQDVTERDYLKRRDACTRRWNDLLARAAQFDVPEPIVQNAWRSLIVGNYLIADGDRMHYGAGNAYDHLYEAECGDAVRSLLLFGHEGAARRMLGPLLAFQREATRFHVAGHKLQLLAAYYWLSRDADYLRQREPAWAPVIDLIIANRQANGLLPPDNYAGDVKQQVISLSSNATCWRGLRDMAVVLDDLGEKDRSAKLTSTAIEFRKAILNAVSQSERREVQPPFVPISLLGDEPAHDPLTATRVGSYYDLMVPYVLGSGIFAPASQRETWIIDYLRQHGGLAMGMIRSTPHQGEFDNQPGVNVLYGLRYMLTLLRRDDVSHVLAGFYGQLAQGMTRDTFIGGEGSRFLHGDRFGRSFYLPPNSAANATFLILLRYLLIQDWDLDDDGRLETLRLLYGIPSRWLADGSVIAVSAAPTAFGKLSLRVQSKLLHGEISMELDLASSSIERLLIRLPLPEGWRITTVETWPGNLLSASGAGWVMTPRAGHHQLLFHVSPSP